MTYFVRFFIPFLLILLLIGAIDCAASDFDEKMTFDDFKKECIKPHKPGELLVKTIVRTDIQEFIDSIPDIDIEHIRDMIKDMYDYINDNKIDIPNESLYHITLVDKSENNLHRAAEILFGRQDILFVCPNIFLYPIGTSGQVDDNDDPNIDDNPVNWEVIAVFINGEELIFDQPPLKYGSMPLLPLRVVFEALGAEVSWDDSTQTVTIVNDNICITIEIGSEFMIKNGEKIKLNIPARIIGGRTLIPYDVIAECFDVKFAWEYPIKKIEIFTD